MHSRVLFIKDSLYSDRAAQKGRKGRAASSQSWGVARWLPELGAKLGLPVHRYRDSAGMLEIFWRRCWCWIHRRVNVFDATESDVSNGYRGNCLLRASYSVRVSQQILRL